MVLSPHFDDKYDLNLSQKPYGKDAQNQIASPLCVFAIPAFWDPAHGRDPEAGLCVTPFKKTSIQIVVRHAS
jgi:hypothetical protein